MRTPAIRHVFDFAMRALCFLCAVLLGSLVLLILSYVAADGLHAMSWSFLTHASRPPTIPGGGMGNAILGSLLMIVMASAMGLPIGILCGVYLSEYGGGKVASGTRFLVEVLNGIPTIVFGIVAYSIVVVSMHTFSAVAGSVALAMIMVPLVTRATEVAVRQVPRSWREAATALGAGPARTTWSVVLPGARAGVVTGAMLAIARIAGETAPLLFTAFGNDFNWPTNVARPTAALPLQVFNYALTPYDVWKEQAWAGALVLVLGVLGLNAVVRLFARTGADLSGRM